MQGWIKLHRELMDKPIWLESTPEQKTILITLLMMASATVYSIIESAKASGLNPYKYLQFIFSQLPGVQFGQHPEFLEDYLPWSPEVQEACH